MSKGASTWSDNHGAFWCKYLLLEKLYEQFEGSKQKPACSLLFVIAKQWQRSHDDSQDNPSGLATILQIQNLGIKINK